MTRTQSSAAAFALLLLFGAAAQAGQLTLTGGGNRIIDINPAGTNCRAWSYGAMPVLGDDGNVDTIFTAGDTIANHCRDGLDSPDRFGDRLWRHARNADGTWSSSVVISRDALPWMANATSDSYVGHLGSPAVVRAGGKWYMAFVASVSDPNLCAAEHVGSTTCGSCVTPLSHFAVLWAVSDDGVTWRVRDKSNDNANPALAAAVLYREPSSDDELPGSQYKSLARVSMVRDGAYFSILSQFWAQRTAKSILVRIPYDATNEWGLGGDPQIVHFPSDLWEACPGGRLPDWVDNFQQQSVLGFFNAFTSSIFTTTHGPYRFGILGVGHASSLTGLGGRNNVVVNAWSNDLIDWTFVQTVRSAIPFFADGRGYDTSVIDPIAVEDGSGKLHVFLSTADNDHNGVDDCAFDPNFGPTAAYVGLGIYEADADVIDLAPTAIHVTPLSIVPTIGQTVHYAVRITATDGSLPNGVVMIVGDEYAPFTATVTNGIADVAVKFRAPGARQLSVSFNTIGPWLSANTSVEQDVVAPQHHRAAGR